MAYLIVLFPRIPIEAEEIDLHRSTPLQFLGRPLGTFLVLPDFEL